MTIIEILLKIYNGLISHKDKSGISLQLKTKAVIGTVQDDPFDCWVESEIRSVLPSTFDVYHSGALTTPDLVIRDKETGICIGLEIKKLSQDKSGRDSRGLTLDYNSCLPCGSTMIKVGEDTVVIPCYYLFALLNNENTSILSMIILDGDFLNYDFNLHKESKYANFTEYNHGPYGEGSVRHRRMYTYPNPLNYKITQFYHRFILIAKKNDMELISDTTPIKEQIIRTDIHGNSFFYYLYDGCMQKRTEDLVTLSNLFDECKKRSPKARTAAISVIPPIK